MKRKRNLACLLLLLSFILGTSRGFVAVWRDDDPQPWLVTDMPVSALPKADQDALEQGIRLPDDMPMAQALEDYCS